MSSPSRSSSVSQALEVLFDNVKQSGLNGWHCRNVKQSTAS